MAVAINKARRLPPQEVLLSLLRYEPETGRLFWKERAPQMFSREKDCKTWNSRFADREAFTANSNGYRGGCVLYAHAEAHRVICAMIYGEYDGEVDHINGDRADNRLVNLRIVQRRENLRNRRISRRNSSGHMGVRWVPHAGKWSARIEAGGVASHLGYFTNIEDAIAARKAAEARLGFHPNHGRNPIS